jgi:hypothetical protein
MSNVLSLPLVNISFEVNNSEDWLDSIMYVVLNADGTPGPQMDLRGINFEMELRRSPPEHEVILQASSNLGTLTVGSPPDIGYLIWAIPLSTMQYILPGTYVGDVRASDDQFHRVCLTLDVIINQGITR